VIRDVQQQSPTLPLAALCSALSVSRSWFYARQLPSEPTPEDLALRDAIEGITLEFAGYGYRRVTKQLQRDGFRVNHKKVLRLMTEECLLCRLKKHFVLTTDSRHALGVYPNLLKGATITRPNQVWVADITYIRLPSAFCYLGVILDLFSRLCVGWHLSRDIDTTLTLTVLEQALQHRQPAPGLIHHSDRGVQYASIAYTDRLHAIGARPSMAAKGNPYDNAFAESFFKTLKREEVYLKEYRTFQEAKQNLAPFIEAVYNRKRLHSSLGYLAPAEYEMKLLTHTENPVIIQL
jgi:transposase InsO family protein